LGLYIGFKNCLSKNFLIQAMEDNLFLLSLNKNQIFLIQIYFVTEFGLKSTWAENWK